MKKLIFMAILFLAFSGSVFPQNGRNLSESERKKFEQEMIDRSREIKTLQCAFVQEKTSALFSEKAVSRGNLYYQSPNALRWEYTAPGISTLILNGNNAVLLGENDEISGNERVLRELGGIIISLINGNGIAQNRQFTTAFYAMENDQMRVILTPVQRRLKDFFNTIEMNIDVKTMLADEIVLNEKSGDKTTISLTNKELNKEISSSMFTIK